MSNMPERIWAEPITGQQPSHGPSQWGLYHPGDPKPLVTQEYIRADIANAEIERLKNQNAELSGEVKWLKECEAVENERLKKVADQAIEYGGLSLEEDKQEKGYYCLERLAMGNHQREIDDYPELAAYLKEKENGKP